MASEIVDPARIEALGRTEEGRGRFDLIVARAVSDTSELIRECRQLLQPEHGVLLAYKTPEQAEGERSLVVREAKKAKLSVELSPKYELPGSAGVRCFWVLRRG